MELKRRLPQGRKDKAETENLIESPLQARPWIKNPSKLQPH